MPDETLNARPLTIDEMLENHVGEIGRGQIQLLAWASFSFMPMALLLLVMVFTSLDPVEVGQWTCVDPQGDTQCMQLLKQVTGGGGNLSSTEAGKGAIGPAFCSLGTGRTQWTRPKDSLVAEFNLTCGNAWKVQSDNTRD